MNLVCNLVQCSRESSIVLFVIEPLCFKFFSQSFMSSFVTHSQLKCLLKLPNWSCLSCSQWLVSSPIQISMLPSLSLKEKIRSNISSELLVFVLWLIGLVQCALMPVFLPLLLFYLSLSAIYCNLSDTITKLTPSPFRNVSLVASYTGYFACAMVAFGFALVNQAYIFSWIYDKQATVYKFNILLALFGTVYAPLLIFGLVLKFNLVDPGDISTQLIIIIAICFLISPGLLLFGGISDHFNSSKSLF